MSAFRFWKRIKCSIGNVDTWTHVAHKGDREYICRCCRDIRLESRMKFPQVTRGTKVARPSQYDLEDRINRAKIPKSLIGPKSLLIDDWRTLEVDVIARTYREARTELLKRCWDTIYFDHNLGDMFYTGTKLLAWAELHDLLSPTVVIVTESHDAVGEMGMILNSAGYTNPSGDQRTWVIE